MRDTNVPTARDRPGESRRGAVARRGTGSWTTHSGRNGEIDGRLASDLLRVYGWGRITIEEQDSPVARFFDRAPVELRRSALESHGFMLARNEGTIPEEIVARLKHLWQWRRESVRGSGASGSVELSAFGAWFEADCFDLVWRIAELQALLEASVEDVRESEVVKTLARISATQPHAAARLLRGLVTVSSKLWFVESHRNDGMKVLDASFASADRAARREAEDAIGILAAKGSTGFRRQS